MKKIFTKEFLSSLRLTFWLLIILVGWMFVGVAIAVSDNYYKAVKAMSDEIILHWFFDKGLDHGVILVWFIILCLIAIALFINFVYCSFTNLYKVFITKKSTKSFYLFGIHFLFIIIMLFHTGSMLIGFKKSNIKMLPGSEIELPRNYKLKLTDSYYVDDLEVLQLSYKKMRKELTRENVHMTENYAEFELYRNNKLIKTEKAYILKPIRYKTLRVTVNYFYLPKGSDLKQPGANVVVMDNPLAEAFFIAYGMVILLMLIYTIKFWKKSS